MVKDFFDHHKKRGFSILQYVFLLRDAVIVYLIGHTLEVVPLYILLKLILQFLIVLKCFYVHACNTCTSQNLIYKPTLY